MSMTLNDLERRNSPYFAFIHGIRHIFRPIISQWLKIDVRKILSPSSSLLLLAKTITHPTLQRGLSAIAELFVIIIIIMLYRT